MSNETNPVSVNIQPNSHAYKKKQISEKKVQPIINKNDLVRPNDSLGAKIKKTFIKKDFKEIREWAVKDFIIPAAKNLAMNMLGMAFFGKSNGWSWPNFGGSSYYNRNGGNSYYDYRGSYGYNNYNRSSYDYSRPGSDNRNSDRDQVDYKKIIVRERRAAEAIVDNLRDYIKDQGSVSVATFLQLVGVVSDFTDNAWGWDNANDIGIKELNGRDGRSYLIDVSDAKYIGG